MRALQVLTTSTLPIGLDLSTTGAKLVQLRKTRAGLSLIDAMRIDAPLNNTGDVQARVSHVLDAVRRRWSTTGFKGRRCVVGIGQELLRIRSIRQPRMPRDEADNAVALEAPDRLGFDPETPTEIGWIRAGEVRQSDQLRDEVIVLGAETSSMEWLIDALVGIGVRPIAIEPSFVGSARCFERAGRRAADDSICRLLLDIGYGSTDLIILRGSTIAFYKKLNVGGMRMNQLVAERLGLEFSAAADLRKQRIQPGRRRIDGLRDERTEHAIFEAIRPVIDELAREVGMCLRYYAVSFTGARPSFAIVVGGEAAEPNLVQHLERGIGLPTRIGHTFENLQLGGSLAGLDESPLADWAAPVGLSLRAADVGIERNLFSDLAIANSSSEQEAAVAAGRDAA